MGTVNDTARPAGGLRLGRAIGALLIAAVLLAFGQTARADHETRAGLYTETHYIGVQFAYQFQWEAPWEADLDLIASEVDEFDRVVVHGPDASVQVLLRFEDDLDEALETAIDARTLADDGLEVVGRDEGEDELGLPYVSATLAYEGPGPDGDEVRLLEYVEVGPVYTNEIGDGTRIFGLVAPAEALADAYVEVQTTFIPNLGMSGLFFAGQPANDGGDDDARTRASDGDRGARHGRNDAGASAAEQEYLATLETETEVIADSIERFYALLNDPNLGDEASIDELSEILTTWVAADETARSLTPPPGYEEVHAAYLAFTDLLAGAALDIAAGDAVSAGAKLEQAQEQLAILMDLLDAPAGVDLLDQPSG